MLKRYLLLSIAVAAVFGLGCRERIVYLLGNNLEPPAVIPDPVFASDTLTLRWLNIHRDVEGFEGYNLYISTTAGLEDLDPEDNTLLSSLVQERITSTADTVTAHATQFADGTPLSSADSFFCHIRTVFSGLVGDADTAYVVYTAGSPSVEYYPFSAGALWEYEVLGELIYTDKQDSTQSYTDSVWGSLDKEVLSEAEPGTWEVRHILATEYESGDADTDTVVIYVEPASDSVRCYETLGGSVFFSSPREPAMGDAWSGYDPFSFDEEIDYEVTGEGVQSNGYSDCIELTGTSPGTDYDTFDYTECWAPDVGMVSVDYHIIIDETADTQDGTIQVRIIQFSN